ncbi:MAG: Protein fam32a, variant 2 [Marteilia pararefringens]
MVDEETRSRQYASVRSSTSLRGILQKKKKEKSVSKNKTKKAKQQEKPVASQNVANVTEKQEATPKTVAELNFEKIQRDREQEKISKEAKVSYREKINVILQFNIILIIFSSN